MNELTEETRQALLRLRRGNRYNATGMKHELSVFKFLAAQDSKDTVVAVMVRPSIAE
jgi:hypothetical protein